MIAATNETGAVIEGGGFNAFGERRTNGSATSITTTGLASTTRGFTGHEMLDGLDVIHMNGRIYDPTLGRFLQADPVIQAPDNPQNWNAYTYVFNNPYRYTDPTGMIGQEERQWLGAVAAIAVGWFAPMIGNAVYASSIAGGAAAGAAFKIATAAVVGVVAAGGAVSGGITSGSQGALIGAFTSVLGMAGGGNVFVTALVAGVSSALQDGNFGSGFLSAGVTALAVPAMSGRIGQVVARALVGGTVSSLTGGKFANGAAMGAMQGVLRHVGEKAVNVYANKRRAGSSSSLTSEQTYSGVGDAQKVGAALDLVRRTCPVSFGCDVPTSYTIADLGEEISGFINSFTRELTINNRSLDFGADPFNPYRLLNTIYHESMHRGQPLLERYFGGVGDSFGWLTPSHELVYDRSQDLTV